MDGLIMAGQLLLGLSILVILHEFGHFIAARAFGIKVEKFYLFFDAWGFKLVHFNYKGCEYGIGWLPLGGYVKISGMIDESMDTEQLTGPPEPWEFRSKPAWQRLIVMLAGIFVNIIVGIFIFWMLMFANGESLVPNTKLTGGVAPGIVGKEIGLQPGDHILAVNGKKINYFNDVTSSKVLLGNSTLTINRKGETKNIQVPANAIELISDYGIQEFVHPRMPMATIDSVVNNSNAWDAGIRKGDSIIAVNGAPVTYFNQLQDKLQDNKGRTSTISVIRDGKELTLATKVTSEGTIGIMLGFVPVPEEKINYGFLAALPVGASKAWGSFADNAKGLEKVITGQVKARKALSGPIGIARMFGSTVDWAWFWSIVGLLSMALALMNLLPIPALDGGHALFLIIEILKGKPLSDKFMERAQIVGFCILVVLMVFAIGNDLIKVITK